MEKIWHFRQKEIMEENLRRLVADGKYSEMVKSRKNLQIINEVCRNRQGVIFGSVQFKGQIMSLMHPIN